MVHARHELKTWPEYYEAIIRGDKTFEVRSDDRGGYDVGDVLALHEWDRVRGYSGRTCEVTVTYVLRDPKFGVAPGFVVLGITAPAEVRERLGRRVGTSAEVFAVIALWASLVAQLIAPIAISVALQVVSTILVGVALFARTRSDR